MSCILWKRPPHVLWTTSYFALLLLMLLYLKLGSIHYWVIYSAARLKHNVICINLRTSKKISRSSPPLELCRPYPLSLKTLPISFLHGKIRHFPAFRITFAFRLLNNIKLNTLVLELMLALFVTIFQTFQFWNAYGVIWFNGIRT